MFKEKVQKEKELLFHMAFKFFAVKLNLTQEEINMINVKVQNGKRLGTKNGYVLGTAEHGACVGRYNMDDGTLFKVDIYIKDQSNMGIIETLAHEMVHAKQNLKGEFAIKIKQVPFLFFFKLPQVVRTYLDQDLDNTSYYEQKCEQEAFTKSRELTRQFLNFFYHLENSDGVKDFGFQRKNVIH